MPADMYVASIPKEELLEWLNHRTTKSVFKVLKSLRDEHQNMVLNGQTITMSSCESTALQTTMLLGRIAGLNSILEIVVEE